jgi:hypothetical protein
MLSARAESRRRYEGNRMRSNWSSPNGHCHFIRGKSCFLSPRNQWPEGVSLFPVAELNDTGLKTELQTISTLNVLVGA